MRFEVSQVLDAIEQHLSTDPVLARGVLDLAEVVHYADLDSSRPANLLRLGMVMDALGRHLAEENVGVFVVAGRPMLSDADLTSNERMRIRSWSDDGLIEVLPDVADRVLEVADLTGLPVLSRVRFDGPQARYPWLTSEAGRLLAPVAGVGGAALVVRPTAARGAGAHGPNGQNAAMMARQWRCPERGCASFGEATLGGASQAGASFGGDMTDTFAHLRGGGDSGRVRRPGSQAPPRLRGGVPVCPRHDARLSDAGPRPTAQAVSVRVDGVLRHRFVVTAGEPVVVGRSPEEPGAAMLGHWLGDGARRWISRNHLRMEMQGDSLIVVDTSTNGTVIRRGGSTSDADRLTLRRDQPHALTTEDIVELYAGVELARSGRWSSGGTAQPASVMAEAPTVAMRIVRS
jgi:hypothetical protein